MKLYKYSVIMILFAIILIIGGCQTEIMKQNKNETDFSYELPDKWFVYEEKEKEEITTIKLLSKDYDKGEIIITVFPAETFSSGDAVEEAAKLLEKSLYEIKSEIKITERELKGRMIPFLETDAGKRETINVYTAILEGSNRCVFATLMKNEDADSYYDDIFTSFLAEIKN